MTRKYIPIKERKKLSELHRKRLKEWYQNPEMKKKILAHLKKYNICGPSHPSYKGRIKGPKGYIYIYTNEKVPSGKRKYIFEHRLVMEKYLGRKLEKWEQVHHLNGIKDDNRPENLEIIVGTHLGKTRCPHCLKSFLIK